MSFTPRLTSDGISGSKYWYDAEYNTTNTALQLPNCTCYAWGRSQEIAGFAFPKNTILPGSTNFPDAGNWYDRCIWDKGSTPKLGAIACYSGGSGHVAIVEVINSDGSVTMSQSNYGGTFFETVTVSNSVGGKYPGTSLVFQGYLYNPYVSTGGGGSEPSTPDFYSKNAYLSESEMTVNALYIFKKLKETWTLNAIAGMLGNMQTESTINPGIWESLDSGNTSGGYGLVQWTPSTKYTDWCNTQGLQPSHMDSALARIEYELANNLQWIATEEYPYSFSQFKQSSLSPEELADMFLKNYERPAESEQPDRQTQARYWYEYLLAYADKVEPKKKKKSFNFILFGRNAYARH